MSRVATIAREDARRALRSRLVWGAVVLLGAMFLPSVPSVARPRIHPLSEFLLLAGFDLLTFALVLVAAVGYGAVVTERTGGTVRLVLGLSGSRRDVVLGKFVSRTGVVVFALAAVLAVTNVFVARGYGRPHLAAFWTMGGGMLLYGVVWTAVTVGYSAAFASQYRTLAALVATYAAFSPDVGAWGVLVEPAFSIAVTGSPSVPTYEVLADAPLWLRVAERLNPLYDFWHALRWAVEAVGPGSPAGSFGPHLLGTAVFLLFGAVPLALGCRRFGSADLGGETRGIGAGDRLWRLFRPVGRRLRRGGPRSNRPRVPTVAAADIRHALQNWAVGGAVGVTALLTVPRLYRGLSPAGISTVAEELASVPDVFALPTLVLGVALGYAAVVGEREAGTARSVLGLPVSRREVVLGKLLSRTALAAAVLLPLLAFAEALVALRFGDPHPVVFLAWPAGVLFYAVVWTAVVVSVSAAVTSRYRALAVSFGTFFAFARDVGLWDPVVRPLFGFVFTGRFSVGGVVHDAHPPLWFQYADHLNPLVALATVQDGLLAAAGVRPAFVHVSELLALYSLGVSVLFAAGSLSLGAYRFQRSELS